MSERSERQERFMSELRGEIYSPGDGNHAPETPLERAVYALGRIAAEPDYSDYLDMPHAREIARDALAFITESALQRTTPEPVSDSRFLGRRHPKEARASDRSFVRRD